MNTLERTDHVITAPGCTKHHFHPHASLFRDGDVYAALRDCHSAIERDNNHLKAHFRLARCLHQLAWPQEAFDCLQRFKSKFPDYANSQACETLDREIKAAIYSRTENGEIWIGLDNFFVCICNYQQYVYVEAHNTMRSTKMADILQATFLNASQHLLR